MLAFDVAVIGAGAAGMMCAAAAGKRGRKVVLLDHAEKPGKKILISGGGRCNFTNRRVSAENFLSGNPHFAKSALARYTPADFLALLKRYEVPWHEKTLGQLFCDRSARDITQLLEAECRSAGVCFLMSRAVENLETGWRVRTAQEEITCRSVVIATGGPAIPKLGATGYAYQVARQFGLRVVEPVPALVPLTYSEQDLRSFGDLAGVSAEVIARIQNGATGEGVSFHERMLVTHRGLSGPAILQISSYWNPGETVTLTAAGPLPKRLAQRWPGEPWAVTPAGTEGFAKAEVTRGGVATDGLSSKTFEAARMPGLYFIGEAVDVTGWLGGYNFQWAWASGFCAGQYC